MGLAPGAHVEGPLFPEPAEIVGIQPMPGAVKLMARGRHSGATFQRILADAQLNTLQIVPPGPPYDGDGERFALGVEARRLALAFEYDPFFSLSIARIDPLPHQLEAVYEYFLKLPRIRFLLADDPGAGKTIMAGLLLKELKIRGLVQRTLIVTPANLTFQWQREMWEKFTENFEVMRGESLRSQYGQNPWLERNQLIASVTWVSRIADARDSLLRSRWDLVIVDEAHKMWPSTSPKKQTLAYQLGQELSERTDHLLLMTATPHKGDPEHFRRFLALLDRDVYADVQSLHKAMQRHEAPFYLRRTKEALVTFPDEHGCVAPLFRKRFVRTIAFQLDEPEFEFYTALTGYVEDQFHRIEASGSTRAQVVGFSMTMLQRRMASSVYAVRRSLERMKQARQKILADPQKYRREQVERQLPDDFDELPEDEQIEQLQRAEQAVASIDPRHLREEIQQLQRLIDEARQLEAREIEPKLAKLRELLREHKVFDDPRNKLLIFTEHKETLDYLAGDGRDGRPLGKLRQWGLTVTAIHGGMPIGDRNTPGTRLYAEREFRESKQVMVATEAAGEGINLQFCWLMINYDIPWNPVRLEQRMGRIHRYGQTRDCHIFNFVAENTREGSVLRTLLNKLDEIRSPGRKRADLARTGSRSEHAARVQPPRPDRNRFCRRPARFQSTPIGNGRPPVVTSRRRGQARGNRPASAPTDASAHRFTT
ncbi:MAG: DEAD/DEAH box helicase, partial [Planctomycetota bacterium]